MHPLRQRLFHHLAAAMAKLREFGSARGDFGQDAARTCNGASQMVHEHSWCSKSHAFAILLLPAFIRQFFGDNAVAYRHDLMDHPPMQALAVRLELAFSGGFAPSRGLVALALLPRGRAFASLLGPSLLVIVLGIGGTPLSIHLALEPAQLLRLWSQCLGEDLQTGRGLPGDYGNGGRPYIQTHHIGADRVLCFVVGLTF